MRTFLFILGLISVSSFLYSQDFSEQERLQGYAEREEFAYFVFDPGIYGVIPDFVIVEGSMRGWDHSLTDETWWLKEDTESGLWILEVGNTDYNTIPLRSVFKYRINDGDWMAPPAGAPNEKGGNLVFAHEVALLRIDAEIAGPEDVRLIFPEAKPEYRYDASLYYLTTVEGDRIQIKRVFYVRPGVLQLVPEIPLNKKRLHYVHIPYLDKTVPAIYDGWFRHLYSSKTLGANYIKDLDQTIIGLFAPRAERVTLYLYRRPFTTADSVIKMQMDRHGVWESALPGNWEGWYYDFTAHGPDEPGNHFYETNPVHFTDPWGRVSLDSFGPCRIWPEMKPASPLKNGIPKMEDVIAYEVHVQDFTRFLPVHDSLKGTFNAFAEPGLTNKKGEKIGFDHILDLGVNVVHLMPVQEFLHYPDDEWQRAFKDDPYMIEQGIHLENYQWGYRTSHAFAIESRFRVKGSEWGAQNKQFRDLVQAFHDHDIAVIVDVVFNHTAERMDNRQHYFNFSAMDVPYFYRTSGEMEYIGEYGTETKSEERPMMQRWIIEQCTDMIEQYGIDGFRVDIAGQTDQQTLKAFREAIGMDKIVYGEPWIASADPDYENNPDWDWYKVDAPFTFFQDDSRNAFKGPTSNPRDKLTDRGYAGGNGEREVVKRALSAGFPEDKTPLSGINYLDIHDNWALADRFAQKNWDGRYGVDEGAYKIAATMLFTSVGPIVLHGGTEIMRSKGLAPLKSLIKYTETGPIYIHGKRDSYNLAYANAYLWEQKGYNIGEGQDIYCNYADMYAFWKGLITFRKSEHGQVFRIAEKPEDNYYHWLEPENSKLLGYIVDEQVFVLLNTDHKEQAIEIPNLPSGSWHLIATEKAVSYPEGIKGKDISTLQGGETYSVGMPAKSLRIWIKN